MSSSSAATSHQNSAERALPAEAGGGNPETTIVFTGNIWCPVQGRLRALAVSGDRVIAVNDAAEAKLPDAERRHVEGLLIPSFGDGHAHPLFGGLESAGPQIRPAGSVEEIVARVGRYAEEHPELEWITGASYDSSLVPEGLFDARWLDAAVPDRPVMLRAWDYHTAWVNTRALEIAGIDDQTPDPVLGSLPRRPDGSVMGTLREWGAVDLVKAHAGPPPLEVRIESIERASRAYAALGVTWVQDAWVDAEELEAYLEAGRQDRLGIAYNLALYADPRRGLEQLDWIQQARRAVEALDHPLLTAHTVKFFADGVVENETAAVLEAYHSADQEEATPDAATREAAPHQAAGHQHPHPHGMLVWEPEDLREMVVAVDRLGFQPHLHAIGDRATRVALDAIEAAVQANGPRDRRPVIAHLQLVDPQDRQRLADLGVIGNAEPYWAQLDALMDVLTTPRLGQQRSDEQYPWASLHELQVRLSFGSDWPVSTANPMDGIQVACTRQTAEGVPAGGWTPAERLSVEQALRCYTLQVAYQGFTEGGTLRPGATADLAVLAADPFAAEPADLAGIHVVETWLRGRRIHADEPTRSSD